MPSLLQTLKLAASRSVSCSCLACASTCACVVPTWTESFSRSRQPLPLLSKRQTIRLPFHRSLLLALDQYPAGIAGVHTVRPCFIMDNKALHSTIRTQLRWPASYRHLVRAHSTCNKQSLRRQIGLIRRGLLRRCPSHAMPCLGQEEHDVRFPRIRMHLISACALGTPGPHRAVLQWRQGLADLQKLTLGGSPQLRSSVSCATKHSAGSVLGLPVVTCRVPYRAKQSSDEPRRKLSQTAIATIQPVLDAAINRRLCTCSYPSIGLVNMLLSC